MFVSRASEVLRSAFLLCLISLITACGGAGGGGTDTDGDKVAGSVDSDNDGVADQFDARPDDPSVSRVVVKLVDGDGDGEPDDSITYFYNPFNDTVTAETDAGRDGTVDRRTIYLYNGDQKVTYIEDDTDAQEAKPLAHAKAFIPVFAQTHVVEQ